MTAASSRLASPPAALRPRYDVVIVGSGYGGAVCAARLAAAGLSVCVLERGREYQPGDFPETELAAATAMQVDTPQGRAGARSALIDFRLNDEVDVILGAGLGGGSLINAGVALEPDPRVLADAAWPAALRAERDTLLATGFARARAMLAPATYPAAYPRLAKLEAAERMAATLGGAFARSPATIAYAAGDSAQGVPQGACVACGNCGLGCNAGAKNALTVNYLPLARRHGACFFTQIEVRRLERRGDGWLVHLQALRDHRERFGAPPTWLRADRVILAAGTMGSTEVLLRSAAAGLPVSGRLGRGVSINGSSLTFFFDRANAVNGVGASPDAPRHVGPTITGTIDFRDAPRFEDGFVLSDGIPPHNTARYFPLLYASGALASLGTADGPADVAERLLGFARLATDADGALNQTQPLLLVGHDDAAGTIALEDDRVRLRWPGVADEAVYARVAARLRAATAGLPGHTFEHPPWNKEATRRTGTVHPLGGCGMGETAAEGVVDDRGRVFAGPAGTDVHPGLYVCDGAVIPRSLGINPLLTITALAERFCVKLLEEPLAPAAEAAPAEAAPRLGIQFTETMRGDVALVGGGRTPFGFTVTVAVDDVGAREADGAFGGRMHGTAHAPALSPAPLLAERGRFRVFYAGPGGETRMGYGMGLVSVDGDRYWLEGHKRMRPGAWAPAMVAETTTLYVALHAGDGPEGRLLGAGVVRIRPDDLLRQLTTIQATHAADAASAAAALLAFGGYFGGTVLRHYGGPVGAWAEALHRTVAQAADAVAGSRLK